MQMHGARESTCWRSPSLHSRQQSGHGFAVPHSFVEIFQQVLASSYPTHLLWALKHLHACCSWRPAAAQVRFLTLMSRDFGPVPYSPDQLTTTLLARLERTGSLLRMDDEEGSVLPCLSDLFEGSQDEEGLA